ncbi:T9SS type A sorting domain-containing protein [Flavobacteriales bacterium]|nr:T9SS type A sorting domain-containing protein [Flavobacteriales bacterium]MDB4088335.1 T9SS type A sorting domain-containing protein [Flavobacteriales bacterium]
MGNDAIGYFFIILLVLIIAPLVFWVLSMLYAWVLWLFKDKKKLNESFSFMEEIDNPIKDEYNIQYKLGQSSEVILSLTDVKLNELKQLSKEEKEKGSYSFMLNSKLLSNGRYFIQLTTNNQTITKQIIIDN